MKTMMKEATSTRKPAISVGKGFLSKLAEMHNAERQLTIALPLLAAAANSKDLKTLLRVHLKETRGHVKALDRIANYRDHELPMKICKPMTKLIAEGGKVLAKRITSSDQDREIIRVGRKVEQFEIKAYQELCAAAENADCAHELALLRSILSQEELANELLGRLAAGKGPLKNLIEQASLKRAGARSN